MKRSIIVTIILAFILGLAGCTQANENQQKEGSNTNILDVSKKVKNTIDKTKAMADVSSAQYISTELSRALAEGKITVYKQNQEITSESEYGKIISNAPTCRGNTKYKYFASVSQEGLITVKAGSDSYTAVQLFPKPEKYLPPYDVLNQ